MFWLWATCFLILSSIIQCNGLVSSRNWETKYITKSLENSDAAIFEKTKFLSRFKNTRRNEDVSVAAKQIQFNYKCNLITKNADARYNDLSHKCVLLVQPIGVGIGRWYYDRLLQELVKSQDILVDNISFIVPDLLGSGSAAKPSYILEDGCNETFSKDLPLLTVNDWTAQLVELMKSYEIQLGEEYTNIEWMVVANGGCVPVALEVAKQFVEGLHKHKILHLCLTAPPKVSSLIMKPPSHKKLAKSYRTLQGLAGKAFWWYSLRKDGKFIRSFSEKNLASDPENLGEDWVPQCIQTAKSNDGYSRFSTFSFLAGSLQGGCEEKFNVLAGQIPISVIRGSDKRKNPARSYFWTRNRKSRKEIHNEEKSLSQLLKENKNFGEELFVGGRRCPAHEDANGFAKAMMSLLSLDTSKH